MNCLFCNSIGPFSTKEHIVPESLGNDDLILNDNVCDKCQNYFGKEIENYILNKTPFAVWRAMLGIKTKVGKLPKIDMTQPKTTKGRLPDKHTFHDNGVIFEAKSDGTHKIEITSKQMWQDIQQGSRSSFHFVMTPKSLVMIGRFLGKIGLELLCLDNPTIARNESFDDIRSYVRKGTTLDIWPIFHFSAGNLDELVWLQPVFGAIKEKVLCYSYSLFVADGLIAQHNQYTLLRFTIGTDNWVICLNDRYPHPVIREQFKEDNLKLIWYSREEIANKGIN